MPDEIRPPLTPKELVRQIADDTFIRKEVVEVVLDRFVDIAVEEIVNHQRFPVPGFFSINSYRVKEMKGMNGEILPESTRFKAKLSSNISDLLKLQHRTFPDKPYSVNRDTWRGALKWSRNQISTSSEGKTFVSQESDSDVFEQMLDDED